MNKKNDQANKCMHKPYYGQLQKKFNIGKNRYIEKKSVCLLVFFFFIYILRNMLLVANC